MPKKSSIPCELEHDPRLERINTLQAEFQARRYGIDYRSESWCGLISSLGRDSMVKNLNTEVIDFGWHLAMQLDENDFPVDCAIWLYEREHDRWRLTLGIRKVSLKGSTFVYRAIDAHLAGSIVDLDDIRALAPNATEIQLIQMLISTPKPPAGTPIASGAGIRATSNTINGYHIDDMFILWTRRA